MEDILKNTNIFEDKDLFKLSPDYCPSDIILRMQMRRNMVKDTHKHEIFKKSNLQRNTLRKTKDDYKVSQEVMKIRNSFRHMDLKNKMLLKSTRNIDSFKAIDNSKLLTNLQNDMDLNVHELCEDMSSFVIHNDSDFKISTKPGMNKNNEPRNQLKMEDNSYYSKDEKCDGNNITEVDRVEEVVNLQFTYNNNLQEIVNNDTESIKESWSDLKVCTYGFDNHVSELQNLLIMMALSPKSGSDDKSESICNDTDVHNNVTELTDLVLTSNAVPCEEITDILYITPLRIEINDRIKYILKKYVEKWRLYITNRKEYMTQQRQKTLDSFFEKLEKKKKDIDQVPESVSKAKLLARDCNTYQHRYKVQKHIIALQKAKLEEQNRLIEELKYNKIVEASRQSVDAMREEVRKTYYEIDRQLKPKIKCLTNELKISEIEEPSLVLHCLKVPQFLQRMEKRAREREEKHAIIRERRKQMEEERIRLKQQAELTKAEMDNEEKIKRIKELKEKRKREKTENIRKKQHVERMRALVVMADLHYEKNLLAKYGIQPMKKLMEIKRDNLEKAKAHYTFQAKKNVFLNWMWYTEDMWFERNYKAENFKRQNILKKAFEGFKKNHYEYIIKKQVADDYYDLYVTQFSFRRLREGIEVMKREYEMKLKKAELYYNSNVLFKTFSCWRSLPALNALKREQEARKSRWRARVLQVVPDYTPPDD